MIGKILVGLTHVDVLYLDDAGTYHQIETLFAEGFENVQVGGLNDINAARQIATSGPGGPVLLTTDAPTSVGPAAPQKLALFNYPNPFNPRTTIRYGIPTESHVTLGVYDVTGRLVRHLIDRPGHPSGVHAVIWDGRDNHDRIMAAGVYIYRIRAGRQSETGRMVLLQ